MSAALPPGGDLALWPKSSALPNDIAIFVDRSHNCNIAPGEIEGLRCQNVTSKRGGDLWGQGPTIVYGVPTNRLNEQVKRNLERFPSDFMFQPTAGELSSMRSQIATSNVGRGGTRYLEYPHLWERLSNPWRASRVFRGLLRSCRQDFRCRCR